MFLRVTTLLISASALAACASTTIDTTVTLVPVVETTTTVPTGPATDLLPRLLVEASKLSEAIGSRGDKDAQLGAIVDLWDAVRSEVEANDGLAVRQFDGAIELCQKGEQFNRPADADKCFRNLTALVDSYLAVHG